ncbi:hypothetical protein FJQ98_14080 [Lysinibacillus agricola]|uniref:YqbQ/XkdQ domain-containing protein n=1 Tax=Lysinibacillus agricola TaxID=2590012 RepID=A0ABX7AL60_9BACI|nr:MULTISPECIES: hypothetical protein [Lysinibacillus]KOS64622.1 hypothetical protein AN161_00940 [Lysinibacillus sp. FJAT-14222]QQP10416.1 hypothetical protein FJQ98_14080 [Lysinibacillus agricola]
MTAKLFDLTKVVYRLVILPPTGATIDITNLIESCHHEELDGELSAHVKVRMKNIKRDNGWIHQHVYLAKRLVLEAKSAGMNFTEIFRGSIHNWKTIAENHTIEFIAYDPVFNIMQSKEHFYFKDGISGGTSIKTIANDMGVPLGQIDGPNAALTKKMYNGNVGNTIAQRLEESKEKGDGYYVVRSTKGKLESIKKGTNPIVYELTDRTVESGYDMHSSEDLVTVVKIYSNSSEGKRPAVHATKTGKTEFGKVQDILYKSDFKTASEASKAANTILKERGKPEIERGVTHPDIPWVRKGDAIMVASGTIGGMKDGKQTSIKCIVESVSRNIEKGMMTLTLEANK